jgi:hypothetical protein
MNASLEGLLGAAIGAGLGLVTGSGIGMAPGAIVGSLIGGAAGSSAPMPGPAMPDPSLPPFVHCAWGGLL